MKRRRRNEKIMSLSMDTDLQELLKQSAEKRKMSVSQLVRDLVKANLSTTGEEVVTVVWKVPLNLRDTEVDLRRWFSDHTERVIKAIVNSKR